MTKRLIYILIVLIALIGFFIALYLRYAIGFVIAGAAIVALIYFLISEK